MKKDYERIGPEDGSYGAAQEAKKGGRFFCDAAEHNTDRPEGCPNPDCYKHRGDDRGRAR